MLKGRDEIKSGWQMFPEKSDGTPIMLWGQVEPVDGKATVMFPLVVENFLVEYVSVFCTTTTNLRDSVHDCGFQFETESGIPVNWICIGLMNSKIKRKEKTMTQKLKPFDLEAAKRGERIVTRDGRAVKFIGHVPEAVNVCKVVVFVDGDTHCANYAEDGSYINDHETDCDLFMYTTPTCSINGYEYPEPVRKPLEKGQRYWIPQTETDDITYVKGYEWSGCRVDMLWLKRGLIHLTREAAEAHARAIILAGGGVL